MMVGDVLTVVGPDSAARIGVTAGGVPDVLLERGGVRLIDPREAGSPAVLAAGKASASFVGNDAEARIGAGETTVCGWEAPLEVVRDGAATSPERCTPARLGGASIGLASADGTTADTCEARPLFSALLHLAPLPPVAGGPPGFGPPLPEIIDAPPRSPCDNPGSGCGRSGDAPGGITVVEQTPGDLPFPGGGGAFPGAGGDALP